jgi:hypothetical protein
MPTPINVDRHYRICACNCSGTYYFFQRSFRHSVVYRQRDRRPRRGSTKQRDKAMRLTPFAQTSFSSSLCGALFGAPSPSMQRHRGVKGNFDFDQVLNTTKPLWDSRFAGGHFAVVHFVAHGPKATDIARLVTSLVASGRFHCWSPQASSPSSAASPNPGLECAIVHDRLANQLTRNP